MDKGSITDVTVYDNTVVQSIVMCWDITNFDWTVRCVARLRELYNQIKVSVATVFQLDLSVCSVNSTTLYCSAIVHGQISGGRHQEM